MSEAKYYLQQLAFLDAEINALQEECENFYATLLKATDYAREKVQSTMPESGENYTRLIEKRENVTTKIDELIDLKDLVLKEIDMIDDQRYRIILIERYINGKTWEQIARVLNYDTSWIYKLHGYALKSFESVHESQ